MQVIVQIMMAEKKSFASKLQLYKLKVPSNPANVNQEPTVTSSVETRKVFKKYCKPFIRINFIIPLYRNNANPLFIDNEALNNRKCNTDGNIIPR